MSNFLKLQSAIEKEEINKQYIHDNDDEFKKVFLAQLFEKISYDMGISR